MKKLIALVLALAMVLTIGAAFADDDPPAEPQAPASSSIDANGALNVDAKLSISGVVVGDVVKLYKVLQWTDGVGWTATTDFAGLASTALADYIANSSTAALTAEEVADIAEAAQGKTPINGTSGEAATATTYEYTVDATTATSGAGMYLALITAKEAGTVYNPIIISADFKASNDSDTISTGDTIIGTAVVKKQDLTLEKTEPKITNDVGDTYSYTISTTIPNYSEAFTNQFFTVQDTVSEYLDIDANSIVVKSGDTNINISSYLTVHAHDFTITFPHAYVSALENPQAITITYNAKLNVPVAELTNVKEENNKVTVKFPNDPNDLTGAKVTALKDETREYTFSLDGELFGVEDYKTSELVKVGLNADGTWAVEEYEQSNGHKSGALEGAKYGLYKTEAAATAAQSATTETAQKEGLYTNDVFTGFVTTDAHGLMEINGLDVGTYYLVELTAPAGYVRDQNVHTVKVEATIEDEDYTEYYKVDNAGNVTWSATDTTGTPYTYSVPVLKSYKVTVDTTESTYNMTLQGPSISSVTGPENSKDLPNTKGVELPSTGGIGTTIFYVIGGLLLVGAAIILVSRRKAHE